MYWEYYRIHIYIRHSGKKTGDVVATGDSNPILI